MAGRTRLGPNGEEMTSAEMIQGAVFERNAYSLLGGNLPKNDPANLYSNCPCERCQKVRDVMQRNHFSPMVSWPTCISLRRHGTYFVVTDLQCNGHDVGDRACQFYNMAKLALEDGQFAEARALFEECASAFVMQTRGELWPPGSREQRMGGIPQYRNLRKYLLQLVDRGLEHSRKEAPETRLTGDGGDGVSVQAKAVVGDSEKSKEVSEGGISVFISYKNDDSNQLFCLLSGVFTGRGWRVFNPHTELVQPTAQEMKEAVASASFVVVVLSPGYFSSKWCCTEAAEAKRLKKLIVPVYDGGKHIFRGDSQCEIMSWRDQETEYSDAELRKFVYAGNAIRANDPQRPGDAVTVMIEQICERCSQRGIIKAVEGDSQKQDDIEPSAWKRTLAQVTNFLRLSWL